MNKKMRPPFNLFNKFNSSNPTVRRITRCLAACALLALPGSALAWWGDSDINPTSQNMAASTGDCGTYWYSYSHFTSCAARGYNQTFNCGFCWNGRGFIHM